MGEYFSTIKGNNFVPDGLVDDQHNSTVSLPQAALAHVVTEDTVTCSADNSSVACNAGSTSTYDNDKADGVCHVPDIPQDDVELDGLISQKAAEVNRYHREAISSSDAEKVCWRDLIPLLDEKQKRLSRPGKKSDKNFTAFLRANNLNPSTVRSWRRRLKKHLEIRQEQVEGTAASDEQRVQPHGEEGVQQADPEEIKSGSELLSDHAAKLMEVLKGDSLLNDALRITRAANLVEELQQAMASGKLLANSFRAPEPPQPPPISGDPVAEPDPGTMEELRQRIMRIADTDGIAKALKGYLSTLIAPLLKDHPYAPSYSISVGILRSNKRRIDVGDWLEYEGKNGRIEKLIGKPDLGYVVGKDELYRPTVRWHVGGKWSKPYSLFTSDGEMRVLFDYQAAERFAEAFNSYPPQLENIPRKQPQSVTVAQSSFVVNSATPVASGTTEEDAASNSFVAASSS